MGRTFERMPLLKQIVSVALLASMLLGLVLVRLGSTQAATNEDCRPDGLARGAAVDVPYCLVYDTNGREKMAISRRIIGYFPSWRTGFNGQPRYIVNDIPWDKVTHINYAFGHIENNQLSVGPNSASNPATGLEWPGVPGAEMDPAFPYKGHFNLLNKYKKQFPQVKTLISVGGWAETGGYFDAAGNRVNNGGFYSMTASQAGIDTFANSVVSFLRSYGFNGVDIDYEFPTSMTDAGNPLDWSTANARRGQLMQGYISLMKALRNRLDQAGAADGKYYMLTIAAPGSGWILRGMDAHQVGEYLDFINIMSYDLHGAWNEFVGPNAALYDNGQDGEMLKWNVYGAYQGIGYLNTDWAYHYYRGQVQAGRINIGVPYYTRGWKNVTGGSNGLWGTALKSGGCPIGLTTCGNGAMGIDNIWHDKENGLEVGAGASPMWHAKNLERGIQPSYGAQFGLTPESDPEDALGGSYQRFYDASLVAPWLWNATKKVFLSIEDEQSLGVKADYVVNKGLGGIMFWELSGDYQCPASGECGMGQTLTTLLYNKFRSASAYGHLRAGTRSMPSQVLNVSVTYTGYPVGDSNYPISPKLTITNNSTTTIPGGAVFEFDYGTSSTNSLADQSGFGLTTTAGHTGNNQGGLRGDFHHARLAFPSWQTLAPGASVTINLVHQLPAAQFSNWTLAFGGTSYALSLDYPRGTGTGPTVTPQGPTNTTGPSATRTRTPTGPTATNTRTSTRTNTSSLPSATATSSGYPAWSPNSVAYSIGTRVSYNGRNYECRQPHTSQPGWDPVSVPSLWLDLGTTPPTSVVPSATRTRTNTVIVVSPTRTRTNTGGVASPTRTRTRTPTGPTATRTRTNTGGVASPTRTRTRTPTGPTATRTRTNTGLVASPTRTRTNTSVPPSPTTGGYPAWAPNVTYATGALVSYQGVNYRCAQGHTSQAGWEPPNVPALWTRL